jgi:glucan phosphoethanolaminetransferase (alkaline phosphatase superfamily)
LSDNTIHPYKPWLLGSGALFIAGPSYNAQYLLTMIILFFIGLILSLPAVISLFNSANYNSNNIPPIKHIKQSILFFLVIAPVVFMAGTIIHQEAIIQRGIYTAACMILFTPLLLFINKKVLPQIEESEEISENRDSEDKDGSTSKSNKSNVVYFYALILLVATAIFFIIY